MTTLLAADSNDRLSKQRSDEVPVSADHPHTEAR